jgi:hypothetical protein
MYLYSYPSTHSISGLTAGAAGEIGDAPENGDRMNLEMNLEAVMEGSLKIHFEPEIE